MKIYNEEKFKKYTGNPVRIKGMGNYQVAIAEGHILAIFDSITELRKYFPFGTYMAIKDNTEG